MNFEEYIKNETKSLNLKLLSEDTRNFIPEISGNFIEDKKLFSNFWNKIKLEKVSLKKEKKITKINIKEINTFCNITKKIFLNKYSPLIYREITNDLKKFIRVEELCSKANTVVDNLLPSFEDLEKENKLFASKLLNDKNLSGLKPIKQNKVFYFDSDSYFSRPTLRTVEGAKQLREKILSNI